MNGVGKKAPMSSMQLLVCRTQMPLDTMLLKTLNYFLKECCQVSFLMNPLVGIEGCNFLLFIEVFLYESITTFSGNLYH